MYFAPPPGFSEAVIGGVVWFAALVSLGVFLIVRTLKRNAARRGGSDKACMSCGYALHGAASERCPECGADLSKHDAIRFGREPRKLSWRGRVLVMTLMVWYPLVAPAYLIHVNEALHVWFCKQWSLEASPPRSRLFQGVVLTAEWTDLGVWMTGEAQARVAVAPRNASQSVPLIVRLPGMQASYQRPDESVPHECARLDAAFVLQWMESQGVNVNATLPPEKNRARIAQPPPGITDEAEAIRIELECHGTYPDSKTKNRGANGTFNGWSTGQMVWTFWTPWWYWPVVIPLLVGVWLALVRVVRPRRPSNFHYASRA